MQILVQGVGNEWRGDDAVGILLARRLAARALPGVEVETAPPDGAALMERWTGRRRVVLIDAVYSGAPPGSTWRLDARRDPVPASWRLCSSHQFGVVEALALARRLGRLPPRMTLYGIEGEQFSLGQGLSAPVKQAMDEVEQDVVNALRSEQ